jgi:hypothetical protein
MTGHWTSRTDETMSEEIWIEPAGNVMLGMHRDIRPDHQALFEFLRIEERDGAIRFVAQPGGKPPTTFPMKSLEGTRVTFENPEHDFPQRIIYWLEDEKLCARAEGTVNGRESGSEWCWEPRT